MRGQLLEICFITFNRGTCLEHYFELWNKKKSFCIFHSKFVAEWKMGRTVYLCEIERRKCCRWKTSISFEGRITFSQICLYFFTPDERFLCNIFRQKIKQNFDAIMFVNTAGNFKAFKFRVKFDYNLLKPLFYHHTCNNWVSSN